MTMWNNTTENLKMTTKTGCRNWRPDRFGAERSGAALFIALAFLSLFSLLGAAYIRYMSIESDINARHLNSIRARHYAIAGINSAAGDIWKWIQEDRPAEEQTLYSYGVYGGRPDSHEDCPVLLETHTAEARVSIEPVDASTWAARFKSAPPWPGEGKVFHLVSTSEIKRAEAGSMRTLGRYSVESILAVDNGQYRILSLGTHWE